MDYQPSPADVGRLLFDLLDAPAHWQQLAVHADTDTALARQVLEEAAAFVAGQVAPLRRVGDESGCRYDSATGTVATPSGFADAYRAFWQAGWPGLSVAPVDGGQGLPPVLEAVLYEWLSAGNLAWTMAPGLLHGAYECLRHHGDETLRRAWLPKIASGEWLATMCLTEAHAGSDLGMVRTRAEPQPDGSLRVSGDKIFISGGEHDLSGNIVHLVLGRLPDAPPGPRGLSLFLVPRLLEGGARNGVVCQGIEKKMGLHGSPTCALRFDGAVGWLVGEPQRGLAAMFVMMNAARLHVGLQGIGQLDAAWQMADAYAKERRQMRAPVRQAGAPEADLLAEHPAMRRVLDTQRAWIDGGRLVAYRCALALDDSHRHGDPQARARAERWCSFATPVLKAAWTAQGFLGASECLQVFGGHGYVRDWGIEQVVRDARVTMIYEGTNEIQAIDLLVRKVLPDRGEALAGWLEDLRAECPDAGSRERFEGLARQLRHVTGAICDAGAKDVALPYRVADDYLQAVALLLMAWAWERIAAKFPGEARWQLPAQAARQRVLPGFDHRLALVRAQVEA